MTNVTMGKAFDGLENLSATFICIYYLENNYLIDDDGTHINW